MGKRRILIIGFIITVVTVKTIPARISEYVPSANTIPETINEIR
jgi:small basic protein